MELAECATCCQRDKVKLLTQSWNDVLQHEDWTRRPEPKAIIKCNVDCMPVTNGTEYIVVERWLEKTFKLWRANCMAIDFKSTLLEDDVDGRVLQTFRLFTNTWEQSAVLRWVPLSDKVKRRMFVCSHMCSQAVSVAVEVAVISVLIMLLRASGRSVPTADDKQ